MPITAVGRSRLRAGRRCARGLSLVEVIMALAIAAMISAGVSSLLFAVANGTKDRQEVRRRNVKAEVLANRIDGAVRSSAMLLGRDNRAMVFWVSDSRDNQVPNLSELLRIEYDAATKEIRSCRAPAGLAEAADIVYDPQTTDFLSATASLAGSTSFPRRICGSDIPDCNFGSEPADQSTRLITYGITLQVPGESPELFQSSVALRGRLGF
jgi:prepilin-type N-terminal cleavage/methylation domain-containing protein